MNAKTEQGVVGELLEAAKWAIPQLEFVEENMDRETKDADVLEAQAEFDENYSTLKDAIAKAERSTSYDPRAEKEALSPKVSGRPEEGPCLYP